MKATNTERPGRVISADFDDASIVVYQAFSNAIADRALAHGKFVPPFSFERMTWIKRSFLWMMERSGWARKPGQERVLAVRITRIGWEEALSLSALTTPDPNVYASVEDWQAQLRSAVVRVQWAPERSIRGGRLPYRSIQVGLSAHVVRLYMVDWIVSIEDRMPLAHEIEALLSSGDEVGAWASPVRATQPLMSELRRHIGPR